MRSIDTLRRFFGGEGLPLLLVIVLSYFTVVHGYQNPPHLFWDENYHIASAQKYLNGVYFMEPHPPLGKLLIALGEKLIDGNVLDDQFIGTDYGTELPDGFSFAGYRLFPVLLAWMTAPLLFLIFSLITGNRVWGLLLSFLYIFDNATLVHVRSAMLDSTMLFFSALTIYAFMLAWNREGDRRGLLRAGLLFGIGFAGVLTTKLFGLILLLLVPALIIRLLPRWNAIGTFVSWAALAFVVVYAGVWQTHFTLAAKVNPALPDAGYYQASDSYKRILDAGRTASFLSFPVMLRDSLRFVGHYEAGVPRLDLCKEDENGSPWFFWPFGGRGISYRWESSGAGVYKYLYLQSNPVAWFAGLLGVFLALVLLVGSVILPVRQRPGSALLLLTFLGMYAGFFVVVARIDRVLYLYHYLLPLMLTFIIAAIVFREIEQFGRWKATHEGKTWVLLGVAAAVFAGFQFFRPMTYNLPLSNDGLETRELLNIWDIKCATCGTDNPYYVPKAG
jgi:dolichyl-phosphate-mannose-protein mannosyltransferase